MSYRLCVVAVLDVVVAVHGARPGRPVPKAGRLGWSAVSFWNGALRTSLFQVLYIIVIILHHIAIF